MFGVLCTVRFPPVKAVFQIYRDMSMHEQVVGQSVAVLTRDR